MIATSDNSETMFDYSRAAEVNTTAKPKRSLAAVAASRKGVRTGGRSAFDAAETNRFTENHFADATNTDAASAIRDSLQTLRNRCRYEAQNNAYARGIIDTHANDVVGPEGPRLQMLFTAPVEPTGKRSLASYIARKRAFAAHGYVLPNAEEANAAIEARWLAWCSSCEAGGMNMTAVLRLVDAARMHTGSILIVLGVDPRTKQLRLQVVEADRLATPLGMLADPAVRDGIRFDKAGRPVTYYVLKRHPGDGSPFNPVSLFDYDEVPAADVIHVHDADRPGMTTSVPRLTPALLPLANLRAYTMATVRAARRAASVSGTMETTSPDVEVDGDYEAMEELEIPDDSMLTLPAGHKFNQVKPEQPSAGYKDFKHEMLNEIGRVVGMPFNVVAGNSGGYNYASGRLDWQVYFRSIRCDQAQLEAVVLDVILLAWLDQEIKRLAEWLDAATAKTLRLSWSDLPHQWFWPGHEHVDPIKEARAQETRLANHTTTLAAEYAKAGKDWETELRQVAIEAQRIKQLEAEFGVSLSAVSESGKAAVVSPQDEAEEDTDE